LWLDTTGSDYTLKTWDGSAWREIVVTSAMIKDGTIVNADVNASAAIAGTKVAPDFGSQTITTTGVFSHALGAVGTPSITFTSDLNTGIYSPGADQVAISTNGTERVEFGTTEVVFNDGGENYDFRIEGDTITSLFFVDASADAVEINGDVTITDKIIHAGDTDTAIRFPAADTVSIETDGSERARIDSSGRLLVGTSTSQGTGGSFQVGGSSAGGAAPTAEINAFGFDGRLRLTRATTGSPITIVASGNRLGRIAFDGYDGAAYQEAALIAGEVDGTPGADDMPGRLVFSTTADGASTPTERMRINNSGSVFFAQSATAAPGDGNTTTGACLNAGVALSISRNSGPTLALNRNTDNGTVARFLREGLLVGRIDVTTIGTSYITSSDYRLKENVVPLTGAINRLQQIPVHRFNFLADPDTTVDGFIAHEAQEIVPECVTGEKDAVDADGSPVYQGIDQSKLVPLLTAALQEAIGRIETLEVEVQQLKGQ
jgi:hypothetical protein